MSTSRISASAHRRFRTALTAMAIALLTVVALPSMANASPLGTPPDLSLSIYNNAPGGVAIVGTPFVLAVDVSNRGGSTAPNTVLDLTIPPQLTVTSIAPSTADNPYSCVLASLAPHCELGDLTRPEVGPDGYTVRTARRTLAITLTATAPTTGALISATVTSDTPEVDPDPHANTRTSTFDIAPDEVDLQPSLVARKPFNAPGAFFVGDPMDLQITVANGGPASATSPTAVLTVDDTLTIAPQRTSSRCEISLQVVTCRADQVAALAKTGFTVGVTPTQVSAGVVNQLTVSSVSTELDPDPNPNFVSLTTPVLAPSVDLFVESVTRNFLEGEPAQYSARVTNRGPAVASVTVLDIDVPDGFVVSFAATSSPGGVGACGILGQQVHCVVGGLPAAATATAYVNVTPASEGEFAFHLSATSATPEVVPDPSPNAVVGQTTVGARRRQVAGTVTGPDGLGYPGATVDLFSPGDVWFPSQSTTTRPDGTYTFYGLPGGNYRLRFGGPGFVDEFRSTGFDVIPAGGDVTDLDFQLHHPGSVSGTVRAADLSPLEGVPIFAFRDGQQWVPAAQTSTTADGHYDLFDLPPGNYQIRIGGLDGYTTQWYGGSDTRSGSTTISVVADQDLGGIDEVLAASASISGRVTATNGTQVASGRVVAFRTTDTWVPTAATYTDGIGRFTLANLAPGTYQIRFVPSGVGGLAPQWFSGALLRSASTPIVVVDGSVITGIDDLLHPRP